MTTKTQQKHNMTFTLTFDESEPTMTKDQARAMLKAELDKADEDIKNGHFYTLDEIKKQYGIL
jgi:hypothetical protein